MCRPGRLKKRADFLRLSRSRRRSASAGLVLQAGPTPAPITDREGCTAMRVGFTASKKVGNAVRRNRAKRRLRALADHMLPARACGGHDYVLIARAATVERDFADLADDLHFALKRLGLLRDGVAR